MARNNSHSSSSANSSSSSSSSCVITPMENMKFSDTLTICYLSKLYNVPVGFVAPPPNLRQCILLYLRSPKGGCCQFLVTWQCSDNYVGEKHRLYNKGVYNVRSPLNSWTKFGVWLSRTLFGRPSAGENCVYFLFSWGEGSGGAGVGRIVTVKSEYSTYYSLLFGPNNEL